MPIFSLNRLTLIFIILFFAAASFIYYGRYLEEKAVREHLAALLSDSGEAPGFGERSKTSDCLARGPLPDPECTPGSIFSVAQLEEICVPGYTKTVRNVSLKMRKAVFAEYGIGYPQPQGSFEVDHLIPLALGGDNDIANLFPEAAEPRPGFKEKDIVEIYLYEEACAMRVSLPVAQARIAANWLEIFKNLPPDRIEAIKNKFKSWSN